MKTMKLYFIITALFLKVTLGVAQGDSTAEKGKQTIGTILFSETNSYFDKTFSPNFFNGITYKKRLNFFTTRLAIEYVKIIDEKDEYSSAPVFFYSEGFTKEGMLRLGIEKGVTFRKNYRPYLALDLTAIKSYSDNTYNGGVTGVYERVKTETIGFGATPVIGFEVKLTNLLSIAVETRLKIIYYKSESVVINPAFPTFSSGRQTEEWKNTFNRIGAMTLNFNF